MDAIVDAEASGHPARVVIDRGVEREVVGDDAAPLPYAMRHAGESARLSVADALPWALLVVALVGIATGTYLAWTHLVGLGG